MSKELKIEIPIRFSDIAQNAVEWFYFSGFQYPWPDMEWRWHHGLDLGAVIDENEKIIFGLTAKNESIPVYACAPGTVVHTSHDQRGDYFSFSVVKHDSGYPFTHSEYMHIVPTTPIGQHVDPTIPLGHLSISKPITINTAYIEKLKQNNYPTTHIRFYEKNRGKTKGELVHLHLGLSIVDQNQTRLSSWSPRKLYTWKRDIDPLPILFPELALPKFTHVPLQDLTTTRYEDLPDMYLANDSFGLNLLHQRKRITLSNYDLL